MQDNHSQFLIIKATNDVLPSQIDFLYNFFLSLGSIVHIADLSEYDLKTGLNLNPNPLVYTHIYLMAHGNEELFSDNSHIEYLWSDLAIAIENSDNFSDDTILIIKACDGGNYNVAKTIFKNCDKIKYIFGLDGEQKNFDVFFSSVLLVYYMFWKEKTIQESTTLTSKATEIEALCFDRDSFKQGCF